MHPALKANKEKKLLWLATQKFFVDAYEFRNERHKKELVAKMKSAGLLAPSTYWRDVRMDEMILEVRKRNENNK